MVGKGSRIMSSAGRLPKGENTTIYLEPSSRVLSIRVAACRNMSRGRRYGVGPLCKAVSTVVVVSARQGFIRPKGVKACAAPVASHGPERDSA